MRAQIQIGMRLGASLLLLLALGLMADPMGAHKLMSTGAYDSTTLFLLAANLLGMSVILLVTAQNPEAETLGALAAALILVAVVTGHQLLVSDGMPHNFFTVFSLIAILGLAVFMLLGRTQDLSEAELVEPARRPTTTPDGVARGKKKPARKAAKKTAKKAVKKTKTSKKKTTRKRR